MNQHFNNWIPADILKIMPGNQVNLELELHAHDCQRRWPNVQVLLGTNLIYNGPVIDSQLITASINITDPSTELIVVMYGKTEQDTVVGTDGNILQNQSLHISKLVLNGVDIIKNNFVYKGSFKMVLSAEKTEFFRNNNISTQTADYNFYENGTWTLPLELPILTGLVRSVSTTEAYEKIDYHSTMTDIINKINIFTEEK
jgi:hypothetical protein